MPTTLELNTKLNPYRYAGQLHNAGLSYIINNMVPEKDVAELTQDFFESMLGNDFPWKFILSTASVEGYNVAIDATDNLSGVNPAAQSNELVQKVFALLDSFPAVVAGNTREKSFAIFKTDEDAFKWKLKDLLYEILHSGLPAEQQILPLVAHAILSKSYSFWKDVYLNQGIGSQWHTYISGSIASMDEIDWRQLIQQDIKGAVQGSSTALQSGFFIFGNYNMALLAGAAAGMAASAQNAVLQTAFIAGYAP